MKRLLLALATLVVFSFAAAQVNVDMSDRTISEILNTSEQLSILNAMIEFAGLEETLAEEGPFTVFAPVDRAWLGLSSDELGALIRNPEALESILRYHVVSGQLDSARLFELLLADAGQRIGDENTAGMEVEDPVDATEAADEEEEEAPLAERQIGDDATPNLEIEGPVEALLATGVTSAVAFDTAEGSSLEVSAGRTVDTEVDGGSLRIGEGEDLLGVAEPVAALRAEGVDLLVNDAGIVSVDIIASNGVIHLIDGVLVPEGVEILP